MGLLLTYALQITVATNMTLRAGSMAEQTFNAVERVDEYCHLPSEAEYDKTESNNSDNRKNRSDGSRTNGGGSSSSGSHKKRRHGGGGGLREPLLPISQDGAAASSSRSTAAAFGTRGEIEFKDVNMRYRPGLPLVLCGLTFKVDAGFKVGVVGRTGAGKSSLIGALFRLTEIESGGITIDGVNTKTLGLRKLRGAMALIPQVPVIFAGSIRENLAPFGGHSDAALWSALRRSHLAPVVERWQSEGLGGLDYVLGEGGAPLSAGQKQLLALARALLNPAKILVLDEATANVDVETDALIQETLRSEFSERTLVAVAHRLHTIIEADRVLVMEKGKAVEYGAPAQLLELEDGHFTGMVRETGEATEKFLRSMAAGDATAQRELHTAATSALDTLCLPCETSSPACLNALASHLTNNATALNQQLHGLLQVLHTRGGHSGAGGSKEERVAALLQLKAALAATSQLRVLAEQAQEMLAREGRDSNADGDANREGILASVSENLEQSSLGLSGSGSATPFSADVSRQLISGSATRANLLHGLSLPVGVVRPHRRFSHDGAGRGFGADLHSPLSARGRQASSDGGGDSNARVLRGTLSFPVSPGSSSSNDSRGGAENSRVYQRGRSLVSRLSLDIPAANLAAAAAATRRESGSSGRP
eukprot:GHUV01008299.1.p1 GENE.GHUV01008299.1~~GHUV01008299.1.p1  ORF type:complete len:743 (+),score=192.05 GHUV01008299.1:275-2230(+)